MDHEQIFGPMFVLMLLTLAVWLYMYAKRIPFIQSLDLKPEELTPAELSRLSPPSVSNPSDNLKNLFEAPVLFYALALYLYVTNQVDQLFLMASWAFVLFRILHSAVHCTINIVLLRFTLYALSCTCLFFVLLRSAITHFG